MVTQERRLFYEENLIYSRPEITSFHNVQPITKTSCMQPIAAKLSSISDNYDFETDHLYFERPVFCRSEDELIQNLSQCTDSQMSISKTINLDRDGSEMNCDDGEVISTPSLVKFEGESRLYSYVEQEKRGLKRTVVEIGSDDDDTKLLYDNNDRPCTSASTYSHKVEEKCVKAIAKKRYKTSLGVEVAKYCKFCKSSVTR